MYDFEVNDCINARGTVRVRLEAQIRLTIELQDFAGPNTARHEQHHVPVHDVAATRRTAIDAVRPAIPAGPAPTSSEEVDK